MNSQALASELASEKASVRQILLSTRLALSEKERLNGDSQIFDRILCHPLFIQSTKIACYFSHLNEPQLASFIINTSKLIYLPILKKTATGSYLIFGHCSQNTPYKNNIYGIPEPLLSSTELTVRAEQLDLILVPLVGFTATKTRLGMGGGCYDRTLQFKLSQPAAKPYLVGIAYECQKKDHIPTEAHDIKLDCIITEKQLY